MSTLLSQESSQSDRRQVILSFPALSRESIGLAKDAQELATHQVRHHNRSEFRPHIHMDADHLGILFQMLTIAEELFEHCLSTLQ
jgi:hypothetical protein